MKDNIIDRYQHKMLYQNILNVGNGIRKLLTYLNYCMLIACSSYPITVDGNISHDEPTE